MQDELPKHTVYELIKYCTEEYSDLVVQMYRPGKDQLYLARSYAAFFARVRAISLALHDLGLRAGGKVAVICDVSPEWLPVSFGITGIGGVDVPRGTDSTEQDLQYIFAHSECEIAFLENPQVLENLRKIQNVLPQLRTVIVMTDVEDIVEIDAEKRLEIFTLCELISQGEMIHSKRNSLYDDLGQQSQEQDLATIIYTSGTTGNPKGVMHTQKSLVWEVTHVTRDIRIEPKGITMGFLPPWHVAERLIENVAFWHGVAVAFTTVQTLSKDLQAAKPTFLLSVPRVWESFYNRVQENVRKAPLPARILFLASQWVAEEFSIEKDIFMNRFPIEFRFHSLRQAVAFLKLILLFLPNLLAQLVLAKVRQSLGGRVEFAISGAGALPSHIDRFLAAIGIKIIDTYGMTETVGVTCRRNFPVAVIGTVGKAIAGTAIKLVDDQGQEITTPNVKGTAWHFGPHIMQGYYKEPEKTAEVLKDGWLNSGDLLHYTPHGDLKFAGRVKDTIVLLGGENVEPQPIEDKLLESKWIQQVVVVGQDEKNLGALIVPKIEIVREHFVAQSVKIPDSVSEWNLSEPVLKLFKSEIKNQISATNGFKNFERIGDFRILDKEFEVGIELTQTLKVRRNIVFEKYSETIKEIYG